MSRAKVASKVDLLKAYAQWLTRASYRSLVSYHCPGCDETLKTSRVPGDTLATCPFCGVMYFKITHEGGKVETQSLADEAVS